MLNLRQTSKLSCVNRCLQGVLMRSSGPSVPPWCNHAGDRRALHTLGNHMSFCRGNIESWNRLDWERPLRSPSPTINPTLPSPPLNHVTESQNHRITESQNHRIRESQNHSMVGVSRDLCGSPSPTPCQSRVTQSRLQRTLSRWVLNISREGDSTTSLGSPGSPVSLSATSPHLLNMSRDRDSTTALGSLFQCLMTLSVKKFFLIYNLMLPQHILRPFPGVMSSPLE